MIKKTLLLVIITVITSSTAVAQNIFEKYSNNADVTYVSIKPKMFQMITRMGIDENDPQAKAYLDMVKSITSFKTMVTSNKAITTEISQWIKSQSGTLEELMEIKENEGDVKFYIEPGSDDDHVKKLIILANGLAHATNPQTETVLVALTGNIDLKEVAALTQKMNIPGGKELQGIK